ncbi:hypothetical protein [Arthrobacter sp. PAMC 25486]|uniref:hypothetical protein n=1 Tax=Arthrobacter sp. PAMC 25486 TaxID=1494608 RepID=UPI000692401F|nr:hypothetical protein [Arthrobacter sp. PAMC 25486]
MMFYNDVAADTQERIRGLDWESLLGGKTFEVTSRPKTIDTLRQKLQRGISTPLPNIQDIAGVRFEAEMSLDEQDAVVTAIVGLFGHVSETRVKDLRLDPHSGYRAVHIWLRLPVRVEVQVRTHLQGEWANMYESLADVLGRDIRYDVLPAGPGERKAVRALQELSTQTITNLERLPNSLPKSDEQFRVVKDWFHALPRDQQVDHLAEYREAERVHTNLRTALRDLEADLRATIAKHTGTFDNMRNNGRK